MPACEATCGTCRARSEHARPNGWRWPALAAALINGRTAAYQTTTTWVTRGPPEFCQGPLTEDRGRAAVALVGDRVRLGLPPNSVVSVTGLPVTPAIEAMQARGVLNRLPMFGEILEDGVRWSDGIVVRADVIHWCTGFRSFLDHLAPLMLREPGGGKP
jgi:hypothetical protein